MKQLVELSEAIRMEAERTHTVSAGGEDVSLEEQILSLRAENVRLKREVAAQHRLSTASYDRPRPDNSEPSKHQLDRPQSEQSESAKTALKDHDAEERPDDLTSDRGQGSEKGEPIVEEVD